jgi:hypothetical protein
MKMPTLLMSMIVTNITMQPGFFVCSRVPPVIVIIIEKFIDSLWARRRDSLLCLRRIYPMAKLRQSYLGIGYVLYLRGGNLVWFSKQRVYAHEDRLPFLPP